MKLKALALILIVAVMATGCGCMAETASPAATRSPRPTATHKPTEEPATTFMPDISDLIPTPNITDSPDDGGLVTAIPEVTMAPDHSMLPSATA